MKAVHPLSRFAFLALAAALAGCDLDVSAPTPVGSERANPRYLSAGEDAIPGEYIVVLKRDRATTAAGFARQVMDMHGGSVSHVYQHTIHGFAASLSPQAVDALLRDPQVEMVSEVRPVYLATTQTPATWGLDRIDQRSLPLNNAYNYTPTGSGVTAYIIDTGIRTTHNEFGGRATLGADFRSEDGQGGIDCNGHGTHVAGTVGGSTYGVAKGVNLVAVRVFTCSGSTPNSVIIAAVDWVAANADLPAVANMSLGGGLDPLSNAAVDSAIAAGVIFAVAAGNENIDACNKSPASTPAAITVASSTSTDARSSFSNWGSCVDLFAPGSDITSAWWTSDSATNTISGTSMATPHVAGVIALYLQNNPGATQAQVEAALESSASSGRISDLQGSPNLLLFSPLTPEVLRLNTSTLNLTLFSTSAVGAPAPDGGRKMTWRSEAGGGAKDGAFTPGSADDGSVAPAATTSGNVTLTNNSGTTRAWTSSSNQSWLTVSPASGNLGAGANVPLTVTANSTGLSAGTHTGLIRLKTGVDSIELVVNFTLTTGTALTSGVPVTGMSGASGNQAYFAITVPAGADSLHVVMSGGTGDADLYVRRGALPTTALWDCRPYSGGNNETCNTNAPIADTYYIMVRAFSSYSNVSLVATVFAPTRPTAASGVQAKGGGAGKVNVLWTDNSDNEERFRVRRALRNPDGTFGTYFIIGNRGPNNGSFVDSTVVIGSTYRYQIQACNAVGCSYSAPSSAITVVLPPTAPSGLTAAIGGVEVVDLSWADNSSNEVYFRTRRATRNLDGTFGPYVNLTTVGANSTGESDATVEAGNTYRFQVQACNGGGCSTSNAVVITVPNPPGAPYGIVAAVVNSTRIDVDWSDGSTNETSFRLRRSKRNGDGTWGVYQLIATLGSNTTSHNDLTVTPSSTYRYYVQACNGGGCTNSGYTATVTTPGS